MNCCWFLICTNFYQVFLLDYCHLSWSENITFIDKDKDNGKLKYLNKYNIKASRTKRFRNFCEYHGWLNRFVNTGFHEIFSQKLKLWIVYEWLSIRYSSFDNYELFHRLFGKQIIWDKSSSLDKLHKVMLFVLQLLFRTIFKINR